MTNEQIILDARLVLMEEGKIGTTGRYMEVENEEGERKRIPEPEEIHTFAIWKSLGFSIKKGEHAIAKLLIWKNTVKKEKDSEEETEKMIRKQAFFFSPSQVEPRKEKKE